MTSYEDDCKICERSMEQASPDGTKKPCMLRCGHWFHLHCVKIWQNPELMQERGKEKLCPICHKPVHIETVLDDMEVSSPVNSSSITAVDSEPKSTTTTTTTTTTTSNSDIPAPEPLPSTLPTVDPTSLPPPPTFIPVPPQPAPTFIPVRPQPALRTVTSIVCQGWTQKLTPCTFPAIAGYNNMYCALHGYMNTPEYKASRAEAKELEMHTKCVRKILNIRKRNEEYLERRYEKSDELEGISIEVEQKKEKHLNKKKDLFEYYNRILPGYLPAK